MSTIEKIQQTLDHLERMESNKFHFYAMRAACRPDLVDKMDKHLQHAITGAGQDVRRLHELTEQLLREAL